MNKNGPMQRKAFFRAIESKYENYIPAYFQEDLIPSITHNHGYFISKEFLKQHMDRWGFYTTKSGITFHIQGNIVSVLKYLIRRRSYGLTTEEAEELCNRDCKRALEKVLTSERYSSEDILGTTVYFYDPRKKFQMKERLCNSRIEPQIEDEDGNLIIPFEEVVKSLNQLTGDSLGHRGMIISFLKVHLKTTWRYLAGLIKYTTRFRELAGIEGNDEIHFTTLNKYFLTIPVSELEELFRMLVRELVGSEVINGKYLAMDATHIFAWANRSNPMYRNPFPQSDSYTEESVLHLAQHGVHQGKFYGYKCHLLVDCESELPIAMTITSGNAADKTQIIPLMENANGIDLKEVERVLADAAYDFKIEVEKVNKLIKGKMIVDTNPRRSGLLKNMRKMVKGVFANFGHMITTIEDALSYIPQKLLSDFGVKIGNKRESVMIKMILYSMNTGMRVAVERVFSRLKGLLPFERPKLQKDTSVVKNIYLCVNWMLLVAYTSKRLGHDENVRRMASVV
ncbi:MAG: transposase [Deltaproteobacteria bacterium]|nr:transposase [Deltaproteobacteria bacterium]